MPGLASGAAIILHMGDIKVSSDTLLSPSFGFAVMVHIFYNWVYIHDFTIVMIASDSDICEFAFWVQDNYEIGLLI